MILIASSIFGLSVLLVMWVIYKVFIDRPDEDRSFRDKPPRGFYLVWPIIRVIVENSSGFLNRGYRIKLQARLRRAGVDYSLSPDQFFAGKIVSAALSTIVTLWACMMLGSSWWLAFAVGVLGFLYPDIWLKEVTQARQRSIFKELPFYIDIIILSVEAGANLTTALTQATQKSVESPLRTEVNRVLRDIRAGRTRAESLRSLADRLDTQGIRNLVSSIIQAERMGASLGPILRAQADQRREERFQQAEKKAMEAPVKLLGPLVLCIFPNTFVVIAFLLIVKAVLMGALPDQLHASLSWVLNWPNV